MPITVVKRNGDRVPYSEECIRRVVGYSCAGLENVSSSEVIIHAEIQFYDGIATSEIHDILIKSAADKISEQTPNYQYVAANLNIFKIRKVAYGQWTPPILYDHIKRMCEKKWYDASLLQKYSQRELHDFGKFIDHSLDLRFSYAGTKQLEGKYLVKNRITGQVLESPQMAFMCICLAIFQNFSSSKSERAKIIREFYSNLSQQNISLPTPIMAGVRTPLRQFSSCVLIECGDSLDSISATGTAIVNYVSRMAGIGLNVGQIRAKGSPVRNSAVNHTGITPFLKFFQAAVHCCSAGGVRNGAATVYCPLWHFEIENVLVMKNNRGTEENRARHMDYAIQINGFLFKRLQSGKDLTLFSPNEVSDMYQAFFSDQEKFSELYEKYEADDSIKLKKQVKSLELFSLLMKERSNTGRIYIMNVDHCNTHSSFLEKIAPVRQSNLCTEVTLPTKPLSNTDRGEGEIALCILAAVNVGKIGLDHGKMGQCTKLLVYALDSLIDHQIYSAYEAEQSTKKRRSLGIGVINFANFLAKHELRMSSAESFKITHELFEMFQYYCIDASVELAKLRGPCEKFNETKYSKGVMPIDTYYAKGIDKIIGPDFLKMDWEFLRTKILKHGMRNSTLTALMPSETSSQVSNSTNGIEPPRALISVKQSKDGILKQVVPDIETVGPHYELLWDIGDNWGYLTHVGIMQKFIDQSISANTNYDPGKFRDGKISMQTMLQDLLYAYSIGIKTLYYHNTRDNASEKQVIGDVCSGGTCKI
ncbi:MAG: ribonucleoside-diphosphate reductase subunit alpha [Puniceicoccales bacterium]|jgi:ribonucleoside-diphosphate reductase alpha chain|nr:ribonucleoside-diphosphate reductase subunit alpha [Puniceicoccales bacterium]